MGCLLGWVGNLLVTESKTQSRTQGLTNWEWSDSYSWQGKQVILIVSKQRQDLKIIKFKDNFKNISILEKVRL